MVSVREFAQKEVDGLEAILTAAYRPPCGSHKSHSYAKDEFKNTCDRCGWNRSGWRRIGKKDAVDIQTRLEVLRSVLAVEQTNNES